MLYLGHQPGRSPTNCPHVDPPSFLLDPGGRKRILSPQEPVYLGSPNSSCPQFLSAVRSQVLQRGRLGYWHRACPAHSAQRWSTLEADTWEPSCGRLRLLLPPRQGLPPSFSGSSSGHPRLPSPSGDHWSGHCPTDFVTGLPTSQGLNIHSVRPAFSKMVSLHSPTQTVRPAGLKRRTY